jgi:hypothetical protein
MKHRNKATPKKFLLPFLLKEAAVMAAFFVFQLFCSGLHDSKGLRSDHIIGERTVQEQQLVVLHCLTEGI